MPRAGTVRRCGTETERGEGSKECHSAHAFKLVINYSDRNIIHDTLLVIHKHRVCATCPRRSEKKVMEGGLPLGFGPLTLDY